jgi:murein DD-endopeptidase MepM/ murein hydrolase activator NlpD
VLRRRCAVVAAALAVGATSLPAATGAATGGGASPGAGTPSATPVVTAVACARLCPGVLHVTPGSSVVAVVGTHLDGAVSVRFLGRAGSKDDRLSPATVRSARKLEVIVPAGIHSGAIQVQANGARSKTTTTKLTVAAGHPPDFDAVVDAAQLTDGGKVTLRYVAHAGGDVAIDLVHGTKTATTWSVDDMPAGTVRTLVWNGRVDGKAVAAGTYAFRVHAGDGVKAALDPATSAPVSVVREVFPILGAHTFGTGAGRFGAGRVGHVHQGQDTFAKCGTPLVAARSGVVYMRAFQSLAGNYLVINVPSGQSDMYAHMRAPALLKAGTHVRAGQKIGYVGDTGDADGCHLHFEMWSKPGWYQGGEPFDPLPSLKKWDRESRRR